MDSGGKNRKPVLGFLSVLEDEKHGLFGGYLLLNVAGRPLEFHCTAPIRANRAQQILYGPTLDAFLYGEQIGQTLVAKAKARPAVVCTDRSAVMALREHVSLPVALVIPEEPTEGESPSVPFDAKASGGTDAASTWRHDGPHGNGANGNGAPVNGPHLVGFQLGRNRLAVGAETTGDRQTIVDRIGTLAETFDLGEPFTRIREAIQEAQKAVR